MYYLPTLTAPVPQLIQEVEPQVEQLPHELEPLVAAVSPNNDASDTSMISISSKSLNKFSTSFSP